MHHLIEETDMIVNTKYIAPLLAMSVILGVVEAKAASKDTKESKGAVIFKIHDIVPEKNTDGKVIYCNVGATFFNRTSDDVANVSLSLNWNDEIIGEIIDIEEREERERLRDKPKAPKSRYSTSSFTSKMISASLKLPPIKVNQQITLKTKVDTDRCFLLLNDMDVVVNNCGTMSTSSSRDKCSSFFQYISPKNPEYYNDFKEISWENQIAEEDEQVEQIQKDIDEIFKDTIKTIEELTDPVNVTK